MPRPRPTRRRSNENGRQPFSVSARNYIQFRLLPSEDSNLGPGD